MGPLEIFCRKCVLLLFLPVWEVGKGVDVGGWEGGMPEQSLAWVWMGLSRLQLDFRIQISFQKAIKMALKCILSVNSHLSESRCKLVPPMVV